MPVSYTPNSEWEAPVIIGGTPATPTRMNTIEDGLKAVSDAFDALEAGDTTIGGATPTDGDVLTYDTATGWGAAAPTGGGGGATDLEGLSDVDLTTPSDRDVLRYQTSSTQWKNEPLIVDVAEIDATGTASSSTYLRGDGTWSTPAGGGGGGAVDSVNGQTGTVSLDQDDIGDGTTYKQYSATEKTKLSGVATGATANDTDANLKDRANHTGTQAASTIGSGTMATARLGSGTASSATFLRGDQTWATPAGSGGATGAMVYLNAATLTAATGTRVVIMDTVEVADSGFSYNTTTGEMTLTNAGWYSVFGHVRFSTNPTGFNTAFITVGGTSVISGSQVSASTSEVFVAGVDYFAASTVLKLETSTGTTVSVAGGNRRFTTLRVVRHA